MLTNSTLENVPEDRDFQQIVATFPNDVESFFLRCATADQRDGTIVNSHAAEDAARLLLATLLGIRVLARARPDREHLEGVVRPVFALLDGKREKRVTGVRRPNKPRERHKLQRAFWLRGRAGATPHLPALSTKETNRCLTA